MRTLYRNGRIYTTEALDATALLVDGKTIAWLGDEHAAALQNAQASVDLGGCLVTPAFVDAHVHGTANGLALTTVDLAHTETLAQALDLVERHTRAVRGRPVLGSGWDESRWPERRAPTAQELDHAGYGGVVYLARVDAHSAVVSSALLATVSGTAGYRADGLLTGAAHDAARTAAFSTLTAGQVRAAQRATRQRAATLGIACLHEMGGPTISGADDFAAFLALARDEPGPEVIGYWGELLGIEAARELGAIGAGGDLFCDGSLGSHTAALLAPYADRPDSKGELHHSVREVAEHLIRCNEAGLQAGFHAIGDAAVELILDAVDLASAQSGRLAGAGHRVEHAEMVANPVRFAAAGLTASVQPAFDAAWGGTGGMYAERLGAARALGLNRLSELAAAGVPLAFGSDAPVTALDPWGTVRAAAYPSEPGAAISPRSAFAAHTRGGWRAAGRADEGVLSTGAAATFAIWSAGDLAVDSPDERVSRWSTDVRAGIPGLPDLSPGVELPHCRATVLYGTTIFDADA